MGVSCFCDIFTLLYDKILSVFLFIKSKVLFWNKRSPDRLLIQRLELKIGVAKSLNPG